MAGAALGGNNQDIKKLDEHGNFGNSTGFQSFHKFLLTTVDNPNK
jgi:hypothetical protein